MNRRRGRANRFQGNSQDTSGEVGEESQQQDDEEEDVVEEKKYTQENFKNFIKIHDFHIFFAQKSKFSSPEIPKISFQVEEQEEEEVEDEFGAEEEPEEQGGDGMEF